MTATARPIRPLAPRRTSQSLPTDRRGALASISIPATCYGTVRVPVAQNKWPAGLGNRAGPEGEFSMTSIQTASIEMRDFYEPTLTARVNVGDRDCCAQCGRCRERNNGDVEFYIRVDRNDEVFICGDCAFQVDQKFVRGVVEAQSVCLRCASALTYSCSYSVLVKDTLFFLASSGHRA